MTESTYGLLTDQDDPRHGTANAYSYHGCRCDRCTAANTAVQQDARDRRRKREYEDIPPEVHGTRNGYDNYGCRCADCTAANTRKGK